MLEVMVIGKRLRNRFTLTNEERRTVCEAPFIVRTFPVQIKRIPIGLRSVINDSNERRGEQGYRKGCGCRSVDLTLTRSVIQETLQ